MSAYAEERSEISFGVRPNSGGKLQGVEDLHVDVVFQGSTSALDSEACAKGEGLGPGVEDSGGDTVIETEPPSVEESQPEPMVSEVSVIVMSASVIESIRVGRVMGSEVLRC